VPKGAAAVRELVATGALRFEGTLRVLDVGAGLGATTWGLVRALEAAGLRGTVEATWIDADARALEVGESLWRARAGRGAVELRVRTAARPVGPLDDLPRFDVVLAGQVLSELDVGAPDPARVEAHAALLAAWLERRVADDGTLVVVEPALRDRTRHLHRVRDALAARPGVTIFAPCLHAAACPALAREGDWCHEDLPVDLPAWLTPVARAAGLRFEGLTFSYVVLRRDGARLADALHGPARSSRLRVVSAPMPSKGKLEAFVCGEVGDPAVPTRVRAMRLDRDANDTNGAWETASRGDLLVVTPALGLDRPRIGRDTTVVAASDTELGPARTESR
jgi:SAM-dependent methyltransferase